MLAVCRRSLSMPHTVTTRLMKMLTRRGVLREEMGQTYLAAPNADGDEAHTLRWGATILLSGRATTILAITPNHRSAGLPLLKSAPKILAIELLGKLRDDHPIQAFQATTDHSPAASFTVWLISKLSKSPACQHRQRHWRHYEAPIRELGKHRQPLTSEGESDTQFPVLRTQMTPTA